jgi:hypothetical protein
MTPTIEYQVERALVRRLTGFLGRIVNDGLHEEIRKSLSEVLEHQVNVGNIGKWELQVGDLAKQEVRVYLSLVRGHHPAERITIRMPGSTFRGHPMMIGRRECLK